MKRLRPLLRDLTGGSGREISVALLGQVDAAIAGTRLARRTVEGQVASEVARDQISDIEHRGDEERAGLIGLLADSLVTPIDREDLFRLSRSIDDVLDNLRDFVREFDLMDVRGEQPFSALLDAVEDSLHALGDAAGRLHDAPAEAKTGALSSKKKGSVVRQLYQQAVADVLDEEQVTPDMLKRRELLRRLDVVGLRLNEAADALADGAVKRSH